MKTYLATLVLGLAVCVAGPASAGITEAIAAFEIGHYDIALEEAASEESADAHALSARVLLAQVMCSDGPPDAALLSQARLAADKALQIDPAHAEGRLQRAIALSLMARNMTTREARKSGHGDTARDLVESVLADDPGDLYANAFMSVWNIEVLIRGGRMGGLIMGASLKDARRHYQAAIAADPSDASVHWQYARALAVLDAEKHEDEIRTALEAALASDVETALEQVMQGRANALYGIINASDPMAAKKMAETML